MRVIYFHQHFSTPKGAAGIRSYEMAKRLVQSGHNVTMVCGSYNAGATGLEGEFEKGNRRGRVDGIDVVEFDLSYSNTDGLIKRTGTFMKFAWGSVRMALREPYDIAFATTTPLTAGIPGIVARWFRRKPFVFEVRDLWPELPREMGVIKNPLVLAGLSALEWASYRSAHRCIALSPGIAKGIQRRGVSPQKITLVPNGCDIDIFSNEAVTPFRPDGVKPDDRMMVFTGTHGLANGLDNILDVAAELLCAKADWIKIVLVGGGKLKPALMERAAKEELENVIFLDPMPKDELACLMRGADLGIQSLANIPAFYYGTSPNKFFDYIAAGLPVVNNYPGWVADLLTQNKCGIVVKPENAKAFARAVMEVDKGTLSKMGINASELAKREFDRDKLSARWMDWVLGVVTR
jgi:glycosyltransferase involved in cell wall biosynthesis